jgi:hypothetical protein
MLRITVAPASDQVTFKLEGKLTGPWVGEVKRCWLTVVGADAAQSVRLDLTDVAFVAPEGQALLEEMAMAGVELVAAGTMMKALVKDVLVRAGNKTGNSGGGDHAA